MRSDPGSDNRAGFALVAVLAIAALLSGLLLGLTLWSRNAVESAAVVGLDVRMDALLRSAATVAAYQLFVLKLPPEVVARQQLALDAGSATITIDDDSGRVDLNGADSELLAAAYQASGLSGMAPAAFAAHVADWRDADDMPSDRGAEAAAYRRAGLPGPRNGAFRSVSDLLGVLDLGRADVASLAPYVTVFNPNGKLNPYKARPVLLDNLSNTEATDRTQIRTLLRKAQTPENDEKLRTLFADRSALLDFDLPLIIHIEINGRLNGSQLVRQVSLFVAASTSSSSPFQILSWQEQ